MEGTRRKMNDSRLPGWKYLSGGEKEEKNTWLCLKWIILKRGNCRKLTLGM